MIRRARSKNPQDPQASQTMFLGLPRFQLSLPMLGLCVFTFSIITYWLPLAEVGVALGLLGLFAQKEKLRIPKMLYLFVAWIAWAFVSSFFSEHADIAREQIIERLKLALIILVLVNALRSRGQLQFFQLFILGCFVLFPMRGALYNYAVGHAPFGRIIWNYIYDNPNDLAALSLLALGLAFSIISAKATRPFPRYCALAGAGVVLVVILMTQSRGAFLGLVVGMGIAGMRMVLKRTQYILYAVVAALIIVSMLPASVWERFSGLQKLTSTETIAEADPEGSAEQRWNIQKTAWRIFVDHPVVGVGLGTYEFANAAYAPELGRRDTHNTYLNLGAEVGLPGLVLWLALVFSVLNGARRARKRAGPDAAETGQVWIERAFVAFMVASIFGTTSALTMPFLILGILWCSTAIMNDDSPMAAQGAGNIRLKKKRTL